MDLLERSFGLERPNNWSSFGTKFAVGCLVRASPRGILSFFLDAVERLLLVVACWCYRLWSKSSPNSMAKAAAVLFLLALLCVSLRLQCSGWTFLRSTSQLRSETLGRGEPSYGFQPLPKGIPMLQVLLSFCLLLNATKARSDSAFFEHLSCFLVLWTCAVRTFAVARVLLWSILNFSKYFRKKFNQLAGWQGQFLSSEWHQDCPLCILNISASQNEPSPEFGIFQIIDHLDGEGHSAHSGRALPLSFICQSLGLVLSGTQSPELGGPAMEGPSSNERRFSGVRKRLVLFEPCPAGLTDVAEVTDLVRNLKRYKSPWPKGFSIFLFISVKYLANLFLRFLFLYVFISVNVRVCCFVLLFMDFPTTVTVVPGEMQNVMPLAVTRSQLVAASELPQLVATIQVVNHLGDPKRCRMENDSFLSLYMPWGLDSRKPATTCQPCPSGSEGWKHWRNETTDSVALITCWKSQISNWLDDELAAEWKSDGILDLMFFAGNQQRGQFREEVDKLLTPGIFSDQCLGQRSFCESRCCHEGRVLHYAAGIMVSLEQIVLLAF